jgi:hypothetical protein
MRFLVAFVVVAVGALGAFYLHSVLRPTLVTRNASSGSPSISVVRTVKVDQRQPWQDPAAVVLLVAGVGGGAAVAFRRRTRDQ